MDQQKPTIAELESAVREFAKADIDLILAANARHAAESKLEDILDRIPVSLAITPVQFEGRIVRRSLSEEYDDLVIRRKFIVGSVADLASLLDR